MNCNVICNFVQLESGKNKNVPFSVDQFFSGHVIQSNGCRKKIVKLLLLKIINSAKQNLSFNKFEFRIHVELNRRRSPWMSIHG